MRRMLLVGMAALLIGFAPGSGSRSFAQSTDEEGVRAAVAAFYAALNARDIKAMEVLWAPDANVIMIHPGGPTARAPAIGPEAVRQSFVGSFGRNLAEWSVTVNDVRVRVGQGRAVVLATTPVHVKMRGSDTDNDFFALATIVYEQRDGRWLIVHQHVSQPPR
jgi:uncharacterized protein (TIGR02246 family)